jgi:hypothetical protein
MSRVTRASARSVLLLLLLLVERIIGIPHLLIILSPFYQPDRSNACSRRKARKRREKEGSDRFAFARGNVRMIVTIIDTDRLFRHSPE